MSDEQLNDIEVPEVEEMDPEQEIERIFAELEENDGGLAEPEAEEAAPEETEEVVEVAEIDYDAEIPMPDEREPIKLGELKDRYIETERREASIQARENELMRERDELTNILRSVGEIPPEIQETMKQKNQQVLEREHQAMLKAIPEWEDKGVFEKDRTAISDVGASYGFSPQELSAIMDHRAVKLLRDHARLLQLRDQKVQEIKEDKPKAKPRPRKAPQATKKGNVEKLYTAALNDRSNTALGDAAIDALLGNQ